MLKSAIRVTILATPLFALGACSMFEGKGDEIIFDTTLGPRTKNQIEALPKSLVGDQERASYSSNKIGANMTSEDGGKK